MQYLINVASVPESPKRTKVILPWQIEAQIFDCFTITDIVKQDLTFDKNIKRVY